MKTILALFTIFITIVTVGCSDQTSVTGPVSDAPVLEKIADPGQGGEKEFTIDRLVYVPETGSLYHLNGTIGFSYVIDVDSYSFLTSTVVALNDVNPEKVGYTVADKLEHVGSLIKGEATRVCETYLLDANTGLKLKVEYVLGSTAVLEDFSLFVNDVQDKRLAN